MPLLTVDGAGNDHASLHAGALVADVLAAGLTTIFLSADGDEVARIYERLGFRRVARAGIAERATTEP